MERIIFILSYEKRWDCWMVYANRAIDAGDFFQSIGRYIGDEDLEVWPVVRKITETIRKYCLLYTSDRKTQRRYAMVSSDAATDFPG